MTDINQTILQKASGENRLHPDQQKLFLGTYRERVVLAITHQEAGLSTVKTGLKPILEKLLDQVSPLTMKVSNQLDDRLKLYYMRLAHDIHLSFSLVAEEDSSSPYGIVLHTDQALNQENIDLSKRHPELFPATEPPLQTSTKKSLWQKLFGQ
ncbi:DUF1694 domain-containing protein [Streptococcus ovuberis]|uniref:YueI family protein n=1 Tax=Streptococcus ovuberis TaxID=1936207 RepID=A0A7X6S0S8_9STRE|nr:DUF1694 domain-containing protein [Streptococcus ovuberis]NKZ19456.1 YueI family protein [Streptococcus ovuberis]